MSQENIPASILIVDDMPANSHLISRMLTEGGYEARVAVNGKQALDAALIDPPDLILMDIMMPAMNGYETCQHLKANPRTRDIPVIFISALGETFNKVRAFEVGGVDYVSKPIEIAEVLARIKTHLALRKLQLQLEQKNQELAKQNAALQEALDTIKTISGLVPICAWCGRKIREGEQWIDIETYLKHHTKAEFTHGICPDCLHNLHPES